MYLQKLWWNQHQNISINISIRRYVSIRRSNNMCYTLKTDEQNLHKTYSDSDQDPNHVTSTLKRQNKLKPRTLWFSLSRTFWSVNVTMHSRQINYQRLYSKTKIFSKRKECYEHWNGFMDNNVSIPRLLKQVSEKRNG